MRKIPSVDQVLQKSEIAALMEIFPRNQIIQVIRQIFALLRDSISLNENPDLLLKSELAALEINVRTTLENRLRLSLCSVINATGIVLHTNLGRAPLAKKTAQVVKNISIGYSNLEYNLRVRGRGHRDQHLEKQFQRLLPCEAATIVNNNAAALFLILNTFAKNKNILVSRGELIEIGGSFRLPAIIEESGVNLKEVGTTNRTRIEDYREALDEDTGLILRVHPSNYKVVGFSERPALAQLVSLAQKSGIPLVKDAGSGYLFPTPHSFLKSEPTVEAILTEGVDLVCFSGDKLLGGPQAGIILGKIPLIEAIRKNPLMRICRSDKGTYAGLQHTLSQYEQDTYEKTLPVHRMLSASKSSIDRRARRLQKFLDRKIYQSQTIEGFSMTGGGAAPMESIPTTLLALRPITCSSSELDQRLRKGPYPIVSRLIGNRVILDLRTVLPEEDKKIAQALVQAGLKN